MFGAELVFTGDIIVPPNLTFTQNGTASCRFTILARRTWKDTKTGDSRETQATFPVVCWGSLAENVADSFDKGDRLVVWGRLEERTWQDDHREEHTRLELTANEIGASMFYGPCTVTKNPRRGEGAAQAPTAERSATPAARPRYENEEPF
jgi:single-strand DNA-binding protein